MPRVLNKDGIQAAKHAGQREEEVSEKVRVRTGVDRAVFNGHVLDKGTVIELTAEEVANHRRHGVPLYDVADDDGAEVYDVSEPFVADGNGEE